MTCATRPTPPGSRSRTSPAGRGAPVTALGFLIGDRTLVVGDRVRRRSRPGRSFRRREAASGASPASTSSSGTRGAVVDISASKREKGFTTADATGQVHLNYGTSGQTLLSLHGGGDDAAERGDHAEGRRDRDAGRQRDGGAVAAGQPPPGDHLADALRQGVVRGVLPARVRVAVHRRDRRLRGEVQPHAADLRDAQGDVLRAPHRGAAGPPGRGVRERVHAPGPQGLRQAGRRDHGGPAQRRPGLPGRPLARAAGRAGRARTLPDPARAPGRDRPGPARVADACPSASAAGSRPGARCSC